MSRWICSAVVLTLAVGAPLVTAGAAAAAPAVGTVAQTPTTDEDTGWGRAPMNDTGWGRPTP